MAFTSVEDSISDTAKAFQGNSQALQQRYTQKKDLFDLLALNMIKKQQDAAKNKLLMSQQQMQGTVIEQMENAVTKSNPDEVNTQNETATGVAGALATKDANAKKMASAGVAANPAGNMRTLAGGGIIGFANEGEVKSPNETREEQIKILRNKYDEKLISKSEYEQQASEIRAKAPNSPGALAAYKKADDLFFATSKNKLPIDPEEEYKKTQSLGNPSVNYGVKPGIPFSPIPGADGRTGRGQTELGGDNRDDDPFGDSTNLGETDTRIDPNLKLGGERKYEGLPGLVDNSMITENKVRDINYNAPVTPENVKNIQNKTEAGIASLLDPNPERANFAARMQADRVKAQQDMESRFDSNKLTRMLAGAQGDTLGSTLRGAATAGLASDRESDALRLGGINDINKLGMDEFNKLAEIKYQGSDLGQKYVKGEKEIAQKDSSNKLLADSGNQKKDIAEYQVQSSERLATYNTKVKKEMAVVENKILQDNIDVKKESNRILKTKGKRDSAQYILVNQQKNLELALAKIRKVHADKLKIELGTGTIEEKKAAREESKKSLEAALKNTSELYGNDLEAARIILRSLNTDAISFGDYKKNRNKLKP